MRDVISFSLDCFGFVCDVAPWGGAESNLWQELQPIGGRQALPPVESAHPPSTGASHVLIHHRDNVPLPEGQLIRTLCSVVVQGLCELVLK